MGSSEYLPQPQASIEEATTACSVAMGQCGVRLTVCNVPQ